MRHPLFKNKRLSILLITTVQQYKNHYARIHDFIGGDEFLSNFASDKLSMNLERLMENILNHLWEELFEQESVEVNKRCARVLLGKLCVEGNLSSIHVCMDSSLGYPLCIPSWRKMSRIRIHPI